MKPNEVARSSQKSAAGSQKGGREKGAAIKVGRGKTLLGKTIIFFTKTISFYIILSHYFFI